MKGILIFLLACNLVAATFGAVEILNPPFSDQQLRENLVDTWEAHTLATVLLIGFLAIVAILSALAWRFGQSRTKRLATATTAAAVCGLCLYVVDHILITNQVARVTGQVFGGFYGIF